MDSKRWVHYGLSGIEAERLLIEKGVPGSFLLRQSRSSPGNFTLSVRRNDYFAHIRIQNTGDFLSIVGGEKFATSAELIHFYQENRGQLIEKNGSVIELRYPISVDEFSLESARWFHGHITAKESQSLLLEKGSNGSFLLRESIHQPGSYVLSVVTGAVVSHILVWRRHNTQFDIGGGPQFATLGQLIKYYMKYPMMDKTGGIVYLKQPIHVTRLNVSTLDMRIRQLEKESIRGEYLSGFLEEFEALHEDINDKSRLEGSKPYNLPKNRFKHILPFDATRVVLRDCSPNIPGSDYVNANYITVPGFLAESLQTAIDECESNAMVGQDNLESHSKASESRKLRFLSTNPQYIATQGVLPDTLVDFWRMVWQERSSIIVALIKENEPGKNNKCERYWPSALEGQLVLTTPNGRLCIRHRSERNVQDNHIREFSVTFTQNISTDTSDAWETVTSPQSPARTVYLFQFLGWPEQGPLRDPSNLLNFLFHISTFQENFDATGPMIVHCSSGIGRTGTFIVVDMLVNCIRGSGLHAELDVARTVASLREQRSGMVQTEAQYRFIYKALQEFISRLKLRVQLRNALQPCGVDYTNLKQPPKNADGSHAPSSSLPTPKVKERSEGNATNDIQTSLRFGESAPCSGRPPALPPHSSHNQQGLFTSDSPFFASSIETSETALCPSFRLSSR